MPHQLTAATVNIQDVLSDALHRIALFVPKLLAFIAILIVGWLVGRLLLKLAHASLERIGFNSAADKGGIGALLSRTNHTAAEVVARLAYYAVLLFTLQTAFAVWGPNPVSDLIRSVTNWLPKLVIAIVILVVAAWIARAVRDIVATALGGLSYGKLLSRILGYFVIGLGVIAALNQIGVATTVTTPILIAVLATTGGTLVVGVGGGMIRPMQKRWEGWLDKAEHESQVIRRHAQAYANADRTTTGFTFGYIDPPRMTPPPASKAAVPKPGPKDEPAPKNDRPADATDPYIPQIDDDED
jgi:hypothetical protein